MLACCLSRDLSFRQEMERRVGNGREWHKDGERREDGEREGGSGVNREGGERRERRESARVGNGREQREGGVMGTGESGGGTGTEVCYIVRVWYMG